MLLHPLDLTVLLLYLAGMLAMGVYFSRGNDTTEEYFLGGRRFSGWLIGLSLVGTSISSITFIAYPADAFKTGWLRYLPNLMLPIAVVIAARWFLPRFRNAGAVSAYEFLEARFGASVRVYGASAFIIAQLVRISTIVYLLALLIHELTGLDPLLAIVASGVFVGLYTLLGGINAVIWTDLVQTVVLVTGGVCCLYIIVDLLPGGLGQVLEIAGRDSKFAFSETGIEGLKPVGWELTLSAKTGTMMLLLGLTNWLTEYSSNQNTVQRFCAARSTRQARLGLWVLVCSSLPIWAFYMFLGTALYVFFQVFPTIEAAQMLNGERKAEQILPYFIMHYLPPGVVGLVIAAALAAAMSSLDSSINAVSTVGINDIYRPYLARGKDDAHYLNVARGIVVAASAVMIAGGLGVARASTTTLQDLMTILVSLFGSGLLGLYLVAFFSRRGEAGAVWLGVAVTALFTLWSIAARNAWLPAELSLPFDLYYTGMVGNAVMLATILLAGRLLPGRGISDVSRTSGKNRDRSG